MPEVDETRSSVRDMAKEEEAPAQAELAEIEKEIEAEVAAKG